MTGLINNNYTTQPLSIDSQEHNLAVTQTIEEGLSHELVNLEASMMFESIEIGTIIEGAMELVGQNGLIVTDELSSRDIEQMKPESLQIR